MATMRKAAWGGKCKYCQGEIKKGDHALFEPGEGRIDMWHMVCPPRLVKPLLKDGGKTGGPR